MHLACPIGGFNCETSLYIRCYMFTPFPVYVIRNEGWVLHETGFPKRALKGSLTKTSAIGSRNNKIKCYTYIRFIPTALIKLNNNYPTELILKEWLLELNDVKVAFDAAKQYSSVPCEGPPRVRSGCPCPMCMAIYGEYPLHERPPLLRDYTFRVYCRVNVMCNDVV